MLDFIGILFRVLPYLIAIGFGIAVPVLSIACYRSFGVGLALIGITYALDTVTISAPVIELGLTLYVADIPMLFIAVISAARWLFARDLPKRHMAWMVFSATFFLVLLMGLARVGTAAGVQMRSEFYSFAAASYAMSFPMGKDHIKKLFTLFLSLALVLMVLCVYRWVVYYGNFTDLLPPGGTYNVDGAIRVIWSSGALALAEAFLLGIYFGRWGGVAGRALMMLAPIIAATVLVLQHRSVWLATMVGICSSIFLASAQKVSRSKQLAVLALIAILVAGTVGLSGQVGQEIGSSAERALQGEGTVGGRLENWKVTLLDWQSHGVRAWLIGNDMGGENNRFVLGKSGRYERITYGAHNIYVTLLTKLGMLGLFSWLWLVSGAMRRLYKKSLSGEGDAAYSALLLVLMTAQLAYYVAYMTDFLQFTIIGMAVAAAYGKSEKTPRQEIRVEFNQS